MENTKPHNVQIQERRIQEANNSIQKLGIHIKHCDDHNITIIANDIEIIGVIKYHTSSDYTVEITQPFQNLSGGTHIPYFARAYTPDLTGEYGNHRMALELYGLYRLGNNLQDIINWAIANNIPEEKLPRDIQQLHKLERLELDNCNLTTLPAHIGSLKHLKNLSCENNQLTELPDSIQNLKHLEMLNLSNNNFTIFPEVICSLQSLVALTLSNNSIEKLSDNISSLNSIRALFLNNNQLLNLPQAISSLSSLRYLNLTENPLQCLPDCISNLSKLRALSISKNTLANLPHTIQVMKELYIMESK